MKFLNKNAYIQTAIFGYSFCTAAKKAFFLIARNIMRVAAVGVVSEIVLILGKVVVPLACAVLFYVCANATMADSLHGLVAPTVVVYLCAFFIAKMFTEVSSACSFCANVQRRRKDSRAQRDDRWASVPRSGLLMGHDRP